MDWKSFFRAALSVSAASLSLMAAAVWSSFSKVMSGLRKAAALGSDFSFSYGVIMSFSRYFFLVLPFSSVMDSAKKHGRWKLT